MESTIEAVLYICRDCMSTFTATPHLHDGDQFCKPCTAAIAEQMAIACCRQLNLEEMGFNPQEIEADMERWQEARHSRSDPADPF
jgi:hypothetical protein